MLSNSNKWCQLLQGQQRKKQKEVRPQQLVSYFVSLVRKYVSEPNPPPSYQANRMVHMGTFNNPNLKSPGLMPMNSPMGSMQSPQMPPSSVAGSNGMNMMPGMPPIGANGMNGNGMVPSSIGMDHNGMGSHVGNGMAQSMSNMQQNGQFHDMRPPPQYSQMQMPSSSQVYSEYCWGLVIKLLFQTIRCSNDTAMVWCRLRIKNPIPLPCNRYSYTSVLFTYHLEW